MHQDMNLPNLKGKAFLSSQFLFTTQKSFENIVQDVWEHDAEISSNMEEISNMAPPFSPFESFTKYHLL